MGFGNEAVAACDEIVTRFGDAREATLREWVANALIKKGVALVSMGRINQAIEAYDDVLARFGDARAPVLQEWLATALVKAGMILVALGLLPAPRDVDNEVPS